MINSLVVYYSSGLDFAQNCLKNLQSKRTSNSNPSNFLSCPAVRASWENIWMFGLNKELNVEYNLDNVNDLEGLSIKKSREPHLKNTNIFNLNKSTFFFCEEPLKIKVTAPYFHNVEYQKNGSFIGGVFDIGRWYRPVQSEIVTWKEIGIIKFLAGEPLMYVEFLTDKKISLVPYRHTEILDYLSSALVNSPFQTPVNFQGSLNSRYEAFDRSDYKEAIIAEIKANLVSEDSASPTV